VGAWHLGNGRDDPAVVTGLVIDREAQRLVHGAETVLPRCPRGDRSSAAA
jgi:hypothetical protein